jgi:hypothetical protein
MDVALEGYSVGVYPGVIGRRYKLLSSLYRTDAGAVATGFGARLISGIGPMCEGSNSISGTTNSGGSPARRLVIVMTQPPRSTIVYEGYSDAATGVFSFPFLPAGNYVVIDTDPTGDNVAQIFDWVASG